MRPLVGIFVGGRGKRMGGVAKGLLRHPDGDSVLQQLERTVSEALPATNVVLVGKHPAYDHLPLRQLPDSVAGVGPLGGLLALCQQALSSNHTTVLALACDLPYVGAELLRRLARHATRAAALAPRIDDRWQPFFARYQAAPTRAAAARALAGGRRSLQGLLTELQAEEFPLTPAETRQLRDWDTPGDLEH